MGKDAQSSDRTFHGYPIAKEASSPFTHTPGSNPVVRGIPLAIAGSAATTFNFVSSFLWANAGFDKLRRIRDLDDYEPRYDPTVIPMLPGPKMDLDIKTIDSFTQNSNGELPNGHHSIATYSSAYKHGTLTPIAVAKAILKLSSDPKHKAAFLDIKSSKVVVAAEESTSRYREGNPLSPLDGVPVAIKDEVDLDGYRKSLGSCQDFTRQGGGTSWCVKKWEDAGAVIVGKLNMHELGLDTTNNNPTTGTPLNPHNPHYYTGGSSGGSAYAVSSGIVPVALGADGGGSIRLPSTFCGLYGLKPSHGRISGSPTPSLAASNGVLGPMASSMDDLEIAYRIMATPDPSNASSSQFPPATPHSVPGSHPKALGIYRPWFDSADPLVLGACQNALSYYESSGYALVDITIPYLAEGQLAHAMTILSEITTGIHDLKGLTASNKILLSVGKQTPASDLLLAQKLRHLLMQHLAFLFQRHPGLLIITPTTPIAGWHIAGGAADLKHGVSDADMSLRNMEYVWLANFTGCPALSVPVGRVQAKEGSGRIPVGLMAMGEWGSEDALIEWGKASEKWAWEDEDRMGRAAGWVDVLEAANVTGSE